MGDQIIVLIYLNLYNRRGARAVEWGRLEICCTFRGTEGSNPSLSAKLNKLK